MMDDDPVEIQPTLTSTVSNVLLSQNNDKNDANDSTPTSSTDAASTYSAETSNATDDPISSTSSDLTEKKKSLEESSVEINTKMQTSKTLLGTDNDVDLLDMNITNVSSEPISEDVEDIAKDLENLLGEPEPINDFSSRRKECDRKEEQEKSEEKDLLAALHNFVDEQSRGDDVTPHQQEIQKDFTSATIDADDKSDISCEKPESLDALPYSDQNEETTDAEKLQSESSSSCDKSATDVAEKQELHIDVKLKHISVENVSTLPESNTTELEDNMEKNQNQVENREKVLIETETQKESSQSNIENVLQNDIVDGESKIEEIENHCKQEKIIDEPNVEKNIPHEEHETDVVEGNQIDMQKSEVQNESDDSKKEIGEVNLAEENVEEVEKVLGESEKKYCGRENKAAEHLPETEGRQHESEIDMPSLDFEDTSTSIKASIGEKQQDSADSGVLESSEHPEPAVMLATVEEQKVIRKCSIDMPELITSEDSQEMEITKERTEDSPKIVEQLESVNTACDMSVTQGTESQTISENFPDISNETIQEMDESRADAIIEEPTLPISTEEGHNVSEILSIAVEDVEVLEDPASVIDELLENIEPADTPKTQELIKELIESAAPEIKDGDGSGTTLEVLTELIEPVEAAASVLQQIEKDAEDVEQIFTPSLDDSEHMLQPVLETLHQTADAEVLTGISPLIPEEVKKSLDVTEELGSVGLSNAVKETDSVEEEQSELILGKLPELVAEELSVPVVRESSDPVVEDNCELVEENKSDSSIQKILDTTIEDISIPLIDKVSESVVEDSAYAVIVKISEPVEDTPDSLEEQTFEPSSELFESIEEKKSENIAKEIVESVVEETSGLAVDKLCVHDAGKMLNIVEEELCESIEGKISESIETDIMRKGEPTGESSESILKKKCVPVGEETLVSSLENETVTNVQKNSELNVDEISEPGVAPIIEPTVDVIESIEKTTSEQAVADITAIKEITAKVAKQESGLEQRSKTDVDENFECNVDEKSELPVQKQCDYVVENEAHSTVAVLPEPSMEKICDSDTKGESVVVEVETSEPGMEGVSDSDKEKKFEEGKTEKSDPAPEKLSESLTEKISEPLTGKISGIFTEKKSEPLTEKICDYNTGRESEYVVESEAVVSEPDEDEKFKAVDAEKSDPVASRSSELKEKLPEPAVKELENAEENESKTILTDVETVDKEKSTSVIELTEEKTSYSSKPALLEDQGLSPLEVDKQFETKLSDDEPEEQIDAVIDVVQAEPQLSEKVQNDGEVSEEISLDDGTLLKTTEIPKLSEIVDDSSSAENIETDEKKTHTEPFKELNPEISEIDNTEKICSDTSEMKDEYIIDGDDQSQKVDDSHVEPTVANEDLVPVIEDVIVKKTIIYEHDCSRHNKASHHCEKSAGEERNDEEIVTNIGECPEGKLNHEDVIEKPHQSVTNEQLKESACNPRDSEHAEDSSSSVEFIESSSSQEIIDKDDSNSSPSEMMDIVNKRSLSQLAKANEGQNLLTRTTGKRKSDEFVKTSGDELESTKKSKLDNKASESQTHTSEMKEQMFEPSQDVSSSTCEKSDKDTMVQVEETLKSSKTASRCQQVTKGLVDQKQVEEAVNSIENSIQDQTTAAVQSILDNMLAEESNVVTISEKEDAPVVHSSYSSYELQKAVQQIQDISQLDDADEISPLPSDEVSYITGDQEQKKSVDFVQVIEAESTGEALKETDFYSNQKENVNLEDQQEHTESKDVNIEGSEPKNLSNVEKIDSPQSSVSEQAAVSEMKVESSGIQEAKEVPISSSQTRAKQTDTPIKESDKQVIKTIVVSDEEEEVELERPVEKVTAAAVSYNPKLAIEPSLDLSEESSSEESSEEEKARNKVTSTVPSVAASREPHKNVEVEKEARTTLAKSVQKSDKMLENILVKCDTKKVISRETRHSSRISDRIKEKPHNSKENIDEPLLINVDESEKEKIYSPKITIKPIKEDEAIEDKEEHKGSLKITITKQSDNTHSILKICSPDAEHRHKPTENEEQNVIPKLVIKTTDVDQHSPKMSTRSSKGVSSNANQRSGSPRITIKPIMKPEIKETITSPLKITIKPLGKPEEFSKQQRHSPKLSKSKLMGEDDHYGIHGTRSKVLKSSENSEVHNPKVTIKPIVKPCEDVEQTSTPKITIKAVEKQDCEAKVSPKITIKPVVKPIELETEIEDDIKERIVLKINKGTIPTKESDKTSKELRKREHEDDKSEKLAKIKLKFSKGGDAHIVHEARTEKHSPSHKRSHDLEIEKNKRLRGDNPGNDTDDDVKIIEDRQSPIIISEDSQSQDSIILIEESKGAVVDVQLKETKTVAAPLTLIPVPGPKKRGRPRKVPLVAREEFANVQQEEPSPNVTPVQLPALEHPVPDTELSGRPKRSCRGQSVRDTLGIKPRKPKASSKPRGGKRGTGGKGVSKKPVKEPEFSEGKLELIKKSLTEEALQNAQTTGIQKVELSKKSEEVKPLKSIGLKGLLEAAKDQNIIEVIEVDSPSNSPKSCRTGEDIGNVDKGLDVSKTNIGSFDIPNNPNKNEVERPKNEVDLIKHAVELNKGDDDSMKDDTDLIKDDGDSNKEDVDSNKEVDLSKDDIDLNKEASDLGTVDASDVEMQPPTPIFAPPLSESSAMDISHSSDIAMFEEETRMSADASSRAQTPAKQVVSADVVEESQSSMQSTATTESGKISRRGRLEVHQEMDGSIFTADQLNEYYWGGNGPFMIQEQVAQFLGIKSFKRKYPSIPRRMVDMQERDYIRENGLASESMCDLGLTAVNSADILDIMYADFQEKYEEYCKHQRDKQAKDLLSKQKAMSLAASQEKSKLDIVDQAVQSAAAYNANFNKVRREQRRACMDLQTMNVHYPKGRMKHITVSKIGNYPVAVVPGQFTDYYKEFTPTELNNLPLNTMLYTELHKIMPEVSDSDSDSSGSDSDDSSSSGSDSDSSCGESCKMCSASEKRGTTPRKSPVHASV